MFKTIGLSLSLSLGLVVAPAAHASISFNYTGSPGAGQGMTGNNIPETVSGETVTATAWSTTGPGGDLEKAALGQYAGLGLGVCNQDEISSCNAPQHEVDDNGQEDFVLFTFSQAVTSVTITLDPVCDCDSNASYYVGNGLNPMGDTLASLGTAINNNGGSTPSTSARTFTLTGLGSGVTSILFGASVNGTNNYFKIESIVVTESTAPEPATFGLAGAALVGLGIIGRRRRNHRA